MSTFNEAIKQIFADIDKFVNSLKDENLSKSTQKERTKIANSLQKIFNEYEIINPHLEEINSNSSKDDSRFTSSSTHSHGSEEDSDNIPYATVKSLTEATKLGYLLKKPTDILEKISKSKQKKYCVVQKGVMYWFQKPNDKKHQGAIYLTGYEFKDVSPSDKELVFELSAPKKKDYQFQADNKDDFESWQNAIKTGIQFIEYIEEIPVDEDGETYEPIDEVVEAVKSRLNSASSINQLSPSTKKVSITKTALPPLPSPEPMEESIEYACDAVSTSSKKDLISSPSFKTEKNTLTATSIPKNLKNITTTTTTATTATKNIQDIGAMEGDEIYEFIESPPIAATKNNELRSSIPTQPPPRPPLPPTPAASDQMPPPLPGRGANIPAPPNDQPDSKTLCPKLDINTAIPMEEDYENIFYGNWSCIGGSDNELSFERGDLIHILNRNFGNDNWWVGERCGDIGLVPKSYLTPVYELVA